jgi:hypothetical protein
LKVRRRSCVALALTALLALAACAAQSDNSSDDNQRGFYSGVSGGLHP